MTRLANPNLIKQIQDIVAEELQRKSIADLTMRYIAERAGITATTIYYYFKSKEELLDKIKFSAVAELDDYIVTAALNTGEDSVYAKVESAVRALIQWLISHPVLAELIFEKLPPKLDMDPTAMMETLYNGPLKMMAILQEGIKNGELAARDYSIDITIFLGMIYGVVKMHLNKRTLPQYWNDIEPLTLRILEMIKQVLSSKTEAQ
jgi:AcrR family transcriptional regulator